MEAMSQSRIDVFTAMAREQPEDAMIRYGLASEYVKLERWREAAEALRHVVRLNPDYTAAYQMLGTALSNQGEQDEARRAWTDGIEVATRTGAWKARQHMEGLLASASAEPATGFCGEEQEDSKQ
jgi:predicted Zn-dependent protease